MHVPTRSKKEVWAGRVLSGVITLALVGSAAGKLAGAPKMVQGLTHAGIPQPLIPVIAMIELACLALYLMPRTALLGTLLLTGYFGGATLTHIVGGETVFPPLMVGWMIWVGAYLHIPEIRNLLPLRKTEEQFQARSVVPQRQPLPTRG